MSHGSTTESCADCGRSAEDEANLLSIRRRWLCPSCFRKYVASKVLKRMESYRLKNQADNGKQKILLPLSGGVSGVVLLQILDEQLQRQVEKRGRVAYELILVHVCVPSHELTRQDEQKIWQSRQEWQKVIRDRFPDYEFLDMVRLVEINHHDKAFDSDSASLGVSKNKTPSVSSAPQTTGDGVNAAPDKETPIINLLFDAARTPTAKSELEEIFLRRLLIAIAKEHACESILWAHSDSRLAAKALADVATGRGSSIPNTIADGPSPSGVGFSYPVRDLYKSELTLYHDSLPEIFRSCLLSTDQAVNGPVGASTSIRNTSISDLLTGYISSQGEKYPSIMANVVRTTAKLQTPAISTFRECVFCSMPITVQKEGHLCYGCDRLKQDLRI